MLQGSNHLKTGVRGRTWYNCSWNLAFVIRQNPCWSLVFAQNSRTRTEHHLSHLSRGNGKMCRCFQKIKFSKISGHLIQLISSWNKFQASSKVTQGNLIQLCQSNLQIWPLLVGIDSRRLFVHSSARKISRFAKHRWSANCCRAASHVDVKSATSWRHDVYKAEKSSAWEDFVCSSGPGEHKWNQNQETRSISRVRWKERESKQCRGPQLDQWTSRSGNPESTLGLFWTETPPRMVTSKSPASDFRLILVYYTRIQIYRPIRLTRNSL